MLSCKLEVKVADLQCGDGLVCVHQVRHDGLQRAVPLARRPGTRTGVRPELTHLLVIRLLAVVKRQQTAGRRVLQRGDAFITITETFHPFLYSLWLHSSLNTVG